MLAPDSAPISPTVQVTFSGMKSKQFIYSACRKQGDHTQVMDESFHQLSVEDLKELLLVKRTELNHVEDELKEWKNTILQDSHKNEANQNQKSSKPATISISKIETRRKELESLTKVAEDLAKVLILHDSEMTDTID